MIASPLSRKATRLLSHILIVVALFGAREVFGWELPAWSYWISVAILTVMGGVALASPNGIPGMNSVIARLVGIAFLLIAGWLAYLLLTSQYPFK